MGWEFWLVLGLGYSMAITAGVATAVFVILFKKWWD